MKKILRFSLLVIAFMAILTIKSYATEDDSTYATVTYTKLNEENTQITVQLTVDPSSNDGFKEEIQSDGWNLNGLTMTKTVPCNEPFFRWYYYSNNDVYQLISVALPYTMKIGDEYTLTKNDTVISSSSEISVVKNEQNKLTAIASGKSTIVLRSTIVGNYKPYYEWEITVVDDSAIEPVSENYTAKFDTSSSYITVPIVVSGLDSSNNYYYKVDTNQTSENDIGYSKLVHNDDGTYSCLGDEKNLIQLNNDLYMHIYKRDGTDSIKVADIKVEKPIFNQYNYFANSSDATHSSAQLLLAVPYSLSSTNMVRNIHYKIGRITDNSILRSIKAGESDSLKKLQDIAKSDTNALYEKTVSATIFNGYTCSEGLIPGTSLVDGAYYYLYAELDTENGKYIPLESITLAKARVYPTLDYSWYMFFYGSDKFNFDGLEESTPTSSDKEQENLPDRLADTGEKAVILTSFFVVIFASTLIYKKYKNIHLK